MTIRKFRIPLEQENYSTSVSLRNLNTIISYNYRPINIVYYCDYNLCKFITKVYFTKENIKDIYYHIFTGFSSGYYGEGTRGMNQLLNEFLNNRKDLSIFIKNMDNLTCHKFSKEYSNIEVKNMKVTKLNMKSLNLNYERMPEVNKEMFYNESVFKCY